VILGLSGGPDSIFLLNFLSHYGKLHNIQIIAAHLDHGWRSDSSHDVIFCKEQAEKLGVTFVSQYASQIQLIKKTSGSQEELGRLLRRQFFESIAQAYNAQTIALAHHQDDVFETFFIRLLRGAGLAGLASIRARNGKYVRPLLPLSKQEIVAYLDAHAIKYLIDPTNVSDVYLRNRIRSSVIPALQQCDARFAHNFAKTLDNLQETEDFLERLTEQTFTSISCPSSGAQDKLVSNLMIDTQALLRLDLYMQKRVILLWLCRAQAPFTLSQKFFAEILRFLSQNTAVPREHQLNTTWSMVVSHDGAYIRFLSHQV
jgi:tRNA(Ile)-lysidine synthetase, N-terminal domain